MVQTIDGIIFLLFSRVPKRVFFSHTRSRTSGLNTETVYKYAHIIYASALIKTDTTRVGLRAKVEIAVKNISRTR